VDQIWLAVDGTNWIHQLWHALGGQDVLQVAVARCRALAAHTKASMVLVAFDRRSFRHDRVPTYKANRAAKDPALQAILDSAPSAFSDVGQPVYQDGYEADDCLATAAAIAVASERRCVLMSPDKDLWQCLIPGRVSVLRAFSTRRGEIADPRWWTADDLRLWKGYGLEPAQWADYQAVVGETGDNVAGCQAWGEKTAARAIAKHGSLAAMLKNPWEISCTNKQLVLLQAWAKSGAMELARDLVTLRTDVPAVRDALL